MNRDWVESRKISRKSYIPRRIYLIGIIYDVEDASNSGRTFIQKFFKDINKFIQNKNSLNIGTELLFITYNGELNLETEENDLKNANYVNIVEMTNVTDSKEAIIKMVELIEGRKCVYAENITEYYAPCVLAFTTDDISECFKEYKRAIRAIRISEKDYIKYNLDGILGFQNPYLPTLEEDIKKAMKELFE